MKTFIKFIKEADVPVNVTGVNVSTDKPVVTTKASTKYKEKNKREAPKPVIGEADYNSVGDSFEKPNEAGLYRSTMTQEPLKISKEAKRNLKKV